MSDSLDIGVDVDSKEFVPAVADRKAGDRVANTRAGIAKWLKTLPQRCRIGMEATGRYYELLARMAGQAGHVVYVIDPRLIKNYARATGSRGKTDAMDAQAIARYVKKESDRLREYVPRTDEQQQMHDLLRKRRALVETRARLEQSFGVSKSDPGELSDLFCALAGTLSELESELQRFGPRWRAWRALQAPADHPGYRPCRRVPPDLLHDALAVGQRQRMDCLHRPGSPAQRVWRQNWTTSAVQSGRTDAAPDALHGCNGAQAVSPGATALRRAVKTRSPQHRRLQHSGKETGQDRLGRVQKRPRLRSGHAEGGQACFQQA